MALTVEQDKKFETEQDAQAVQRVMEVQKSKDRRERLKKFFKQQEQAARDVRLWWEK